MKKLFTIIIFLVASEAIAQTQEHLMDSVITGIEDELNKSITIYPNPASESVTIDGDFDEAVLMDIYGNAVATGKQIPVDTLQSGLYVIRVRKDNVVVSRKLIIN